jgi:hypothetical protein
MREDNASCHFSHTDCQKAPARSGWGLSIWMLGSKEQIFGVVEQIPERGQSD